MSSISARPTRRTRTTATAAIAVAALAGGLLGTAPASAVADPPGSTTLPLTSFDGWQYNLPGYDYELTTKAGNPALRFSNADGAYGNITQLGSPVITEVGEPSSGAGKRVFTADFTIDAQDYLEHPGLAVEVDADKGGNRSGGSVVFRQDEVGKLTISTYWADEGSDAEIEDWNNDTAKVPFSGPVNIRYVVEYNVGAPDSIRVYADGALAVHGEGFEAYHDADSGDKQTVNSLLFRTNIRVPVEDGAWDNDEPTTEEQDAVRDHGFYFSKISYGASNVGFAPSSAISVAATISGTPVVGATLTADASSSAIGATLKYQWLRAGVSISGATSSTYKLVASDVGKQISVKVTATKTGYTSGSVTSAKTAAVSTATMTWSTSPVISGTEKLGSTLTANAVSSPTATYAYQWYRDGAQIKGATAKTYKLAASDVGLTVKVKVTATKTGYAALSTVSPASGEIAPGTLPSAHVTFGGYFKVGETLVAKQTGFSSTTLIKYAWYAEGELIQLSTSPKLVLTFQEKDKLISVIAIGAKFGYLTSETPESALRGPVK